MKKRYILYVLTLAIFASCSSLKVTTDYDKNIDFSKYKTFEYYGWSDDSDKILNDLDKRRIEEAFGVEFKKRDLKLVESNGELVVSLFIVVEQKTSKSASTTSDGYGGYGGYGGYYGHGPGWGYGPSHSTTTYHEYDYEVGTLVISIYDKAEEKLIWESIGQKTVDEKPETRDKNIPKAAAQIMAPFPIAPIE